MPLVMLSGMTDKNSACCVDCQASLPEMHDRLPVLYAETADQEFACLCRVCASSFPSLDEAFRHLDAALSGGSD